MTLPLRGTAPDPRPHECLCCYLERALPIVGCNAQDQPLTERWCAAQGPGTSWVRGWLQRRGGYCDCEVVMNALTDGEVVRYGLVLTCGDDDLDDEDDDEAFW